MLVRDLMTKNPLVVSLDTPVAEARRMMTERRIRHLLVTDGERLAGIVTDRDIRLNMPSPATSLSVWEINYLLARMTVESVMTRAVLTVAPDRNASAAARIMLDHKIGALPVLDAGAIVGIVTESDMLRAFAARDAFEAMADAPRVDVGGGIERVLAIGGSTDGFRALGAVLEALPPDFPGAVLVAQHRARHVPSVLANLLKSRTSLVVKDATDGERLEQGVVYLAPADCHLVVDDGHVRLTNAPPVNFTRPSIDVLFDSVAAIYGKHAIAVILSGGGVDGARGLQAIRRAGGRTIVQRPTEARIPSMPNAAIAKDGIDFVLNLDEIGPRVVELVEKG